MAARPMGKRKEGGRGGRINVEGTEQLVSEVLRRRAALWPLGRRRFLWSFASVQR